MEQLVVAERGRPGSLVGGTTINGLPNEIFASTSQLIVDMVYEHFNRVATSAYFLASNNFLCDRAGFLEVGGFDQTFSLAGGEDRDFCDRWRMSGRGILWLKDALLEHRHSQTFSKFLNLHYRYGRGAYVYQHKRRERESGTMKEDLGFHRSLFLRLRGKLGASTGIGRSLLILSAIGVWEVANAVGFVVEGIKTRGFGRRRRV